MGWPNSRVQARVPSSRRTAQSRPSKSPTIARPPDRAGVARTRPPIGVRPHDLAGRRIEGLELAVVAADVHPLAVGGRGREHGGALSPPEHGPARPIDGDHGARVLRVHDPDHDPLAQGERRRTDQLPELDPERLGAAREVDAQDLAVVGPEPEPAKGEGRRRLAGRGDAHREQEPAAGAVEGHEAAVGGGHEHEPGGEDRRSHHVADVDAPRGRRGRRASAGLATAPIRSAVPRKKAQVGASSPSGSELRLEGLGRRAPPRRSARSGRPR